MNVPTVYLVPPAVYDAKSGKVTLESGAHIHPLTIELTDVTEDKTLFRGRWFYGFDEQDRFHVVRVRPLT